MKLLHCAALVPALALSLGVCACSHPIGITPTPEEPRTISVQGSARLNLHPDRAAVTVTLAGDGSQLIAAHREVEAGRAELLEGLMDDPDLRIEVAALDYHPRYVDGSIVEYEAQQTVQFHLDREHFDRIPGLLDGGGPLMHSASVSYYVDDLASHKAEVRSRAIDAANKKADELCRGFGASKGRVRSISEGAYANQFSWGVANDNFVATAPSGGDEGAPAPGTTPLRLSVNVVFELE